jgi:guanylate kinase
MWNDQLLQKGDRGLLFIISAPAGTGKTTLAKRLIETFPSLVLVPSITTRAKRASEQEGIDYVFVNEAKFEEIRNRGEFLEEVFLHGHHYATSKKEIEAFRSKGKHVLLVIDTQGALKIQKQEPSVLIFIRPPSFEVLRERLTMRGTESEADLKRRLEWSARELSVAEQFDFTITNDDLERAFDILASIVVSQTHKQKGIKHA